MSLKLKGIGKILVPFLKFTIISNEFVVIGEISYATRIFVLAAL
jgi:hypothetical protein